jgi:hypothetical protein
MELRLGSACADSAPRNKVVEILRGYGVEKFRADGNAKMGEVTKELPSGAKPLVYLKRTIYGRIVDKAFPTNCCTWFLGRKEECQERVRSSGNRNHLTEIYTTQSTRHT